MLSNFSRVLELTADCIKQNPANYSVWEYRRRILKALNIDLKSEFDYTARIIAKEGIVTLHDQIRS